MQITDVYILSRRCLAHKMHRSMQQKPRSEGHHTKRLPSTYSNSEDFNQPALSCKLVRAFPVCIIHVLTLKNLQMLQIDSRKVKTDSSLSYFKRFRKRLYVSQLVSIFISRQLNLAFALTVKVRYRGDILEIT